MKKIYLFLVCCHLLFANVAISQTSSGTEFWLAYMENLTLQFNDQPVFAIHISSEFTTVGTIGVPATGFTQAFNVVAGEQIEVLLPPAIWYSETSEVIEGKGIKITADQPIEVAATHFRLYFTEATGVLPITELTDEYLTLCQYYNNGSAPSSFVVVATQDATEVEITPAAFTLGLHAADVPFSVTLNEGDIYQVQALNDLTGSRIQAINGEKIAVFSGAQQANIGNNCIDSADNHLYEQSQPFNNWADLYYFVPFKNQGGDVVRILAAADNSIIYFDCEETVVLNAGEYYDAFITSPTVINSNAPIGIAQFNESQNCNPSNIGDPSMLQLLPTKFQTFQDNWRATSGTTGSQAVITTHFSNVVMKTADIATIELDGNNIADQFSPFPADVTLSFAQITVTEGNHELTATTPFHAFHYGFGDYDAYTQTGNYQQIEDLEYLCLEIEADGIFCVDSLINFTATSNFDIIAYDWQTSDGQSSTLPAPDFTFSPAGNYIVTLTIETSSGQFFTKTYELEIIDCSTDPCDPNAVIALEVEGDCIEDLSTFNYNSTVDFINVVWDFGDNTPFSTQESPSHLYQSGTYTITFTGFDAFNCSYSQTIEWTVEECTGCGNEILEITIVGEACTNQSITFMTNYDGIATFFTNINWNWSNGTSSMDLEGITTFQFPGTYFVDFTLDNFETGCFYTAFLEFEIEDCTVDCTNLPTLDISVNTVQCLGEFYVASANSSADLVDFQWFLDGTPIASNANSFIFPSQMVGEYTLTLEAMDADGCDYFATVTVTVIDCQDPCFGYEIGDILVEGALCVDSIINISIPSIDATTGYLWTYNGGQTSNDLSFSTIFTDEGNQTISLTVFNAEGCLDNATVDISIENCDVPCEDYEIGDILIEGAFCLDSVINISVAAIDATTDYLWTFNNGQTSEELNFSTTFIEEGNQIISLSVVNAEGCTDETTVEIIIENCETLDDCLFPPESVQIVEIPDLFPCVGDSLQLAFTSNLTITSVLWETSNGQSATDFNPIFSLPNTGIIEVYLTAFDQNDCIFFDTLATTVSFCTDFCDMYVPNVFSPNNDEINDTFKAFSDCEPTTFNLKIFNRWGGLVFETDNFSDSWDGQFYSKKANEGVYVWLMEYSFLGQNLGKNSGDVVLLR